MSLLAVDHDFNHHILRALMRKNPDLDLVLVSEVALDRAHDEEVLAWAAKEARILLSHDVNTLRAHAEHRVREGLPMAGVIFTPQKPDDMQALVEDLLLVLTCSSPEDWEATPCRFVPLRS